MRGSVIPQEPGMGMTFVRVVDRTQHPTTGNGRCGDDRVGHKMAYGRVVERFLPRHNERAAIAAHQNVFHTMPFFVWECRQL